MLLLQSLPALRSFCLYCAVGIAAVYFFQATFFVACLALDLKRIENGRNGLCFCYTHKNYDYEFKEPHSRGQKIFQKIGEAIMKPIVKVGFILVTLTFLGVAIWGTVSLEVRFESIWFLPPDTYLRQWYEATDD